MSKSFSTGGEYLDAVLRLGEMAYLREPVAALREYYESLRAGVKAADIFPAFEVFCGALGLEFPEAACVALWLYLDGSPVPPIGAVELLEHCRRIGGRSPERILGRLFVSDGERAILHPIAADFLLGREPRLPDGVEFYLPGEINETSCAGELYRELSGFLARYIDSTQPLPLLLALRGEAGSGRKFLFSRIADGLGCPMLLADLSKAGETGDILLAAEVYGAVVCLENPKEPGRVAELIKGLGFAFAVCAPGEAPPENRAYTLLRREMPLLSSKARIEMLEHMLKDVPISRDIDLSRELSSRRLNPGQLRALADRLRVESMAAGVAADRETFLRLAEEQSGLRVTGAGRVESSATLDDLVLPEEQKKQLAELCAFIGRWDTVYREWGFGKKLGWGRGISALFYGAPGTGKTMAAAALANEAGLALMRVDISQMVSKYIGETQKNIGRIFDEAASAGCVLFFDEADALFSRRAETGDAQDKYANAETAYLLQRIEQHDGVCVLATNLLQNFDEAFRRRIGYMLHFPMPDEGMRERIWRGIFPAQTPVDQLDFGFLAKHLELSGASIKNCAVHAAYLAAVHDTAVTMSHILAGAKNEYAKQGKSPGPRLTQLF